MIYMVEMALLDTARRTEWDAWYVAHQPSGWIAVCTGAASL